MENFLAQVKIPTWAHWKR